MDHRPAAVPCTGPGLPDTHTPELAAQCSGGLGGCDRGVSGCGVPVDGSSGRCPADGQRTTVGTIVCCKGPFHPAAAYTAQARPPLQDPYALIPPTLLAELHPGGVAAAADDLRCDPVHDRIPVQWSPARGRHLCGDADALRQGPRHVRPRGLCGCHPAGAGVHRRCLPIPPGCPDCPTPLRLVRVQESAKGGTLAASGGSLWFERGPQVRQGQCQSVPVHRIEGATPTTRTGVGGARASGFGRFCWLIRFPT